MNIYVGPHWLVACDGHLDVTYYEQGQLGAAGPCHGHKESKRPGTQLASEPRPSEEGGEDE